MNSTVKEMVRQDIERNRKNPKLSEVKQIIKICKEVDRKYGNYGIGQTYDSLGRNISRV